MTKEEYNKCMERNMTAQKPKPTEAPKLRIGYISKEEFNRLNAINQGKKYYGETAQTSSVTKEKMDQFENEYKEFIKNLQASSIDIVEDANVPEEKVEEKEEEKKEEKPVKKTKKTSK